MTRALFMLSATVIVLSCAPAIAELQSTPAEKAQTRALNESVGGGIYASPDVLNGEQSGGQYAQNDRNEPEFRNVGPNDEDRTNPQLQFGDPKADAAIDRARKADAHPNVDPNDFVALTTVDPNRLDGDSVIDQSGAAIGRVTDVKLASDGRPEQITIELDDGSMVRVGQAALSYNPSDRTVLTTADIGELKSAKGSGE